MMVLTWRKPKCSPRQVWRPPDGVGEEGPGPSNQARTRLGLPLGTERDRGVGFLSRQQAATTRQAIKGPVPVTTESFWPPTDRWPLGPVGPG